MIPVTSTPEAGVAKIVVGAPDSVRRLVPDVVNLELQPVAEEKPGIILV